MIIQKLVFLVNIILLLNHSNISFSSNNIFRFDNLGHRKKYLSQKIKVGNTYLIRKSLLSKIIIGKWYIGIPLGFDSCGVEFFKSGKFCVYWLQNYKIRYQGMWKVDNNVIYINLQKFNIWQTIKIQKIIFTKKNNSGLFSIELEKVYNPNKQFILFDERLMIKWP